MSRTTIMGAAVMAALFSIAVGYRLGAGRWPLVGTSHPAMVATKSDGTMPAVPRTVLYWKDPDGKADFAPAPKKTTDGRDYLPVYAEDEAPMAGVAAAPPKGTAKILYYRNPMGLADTSQVPKKDWMGMDYIPVYEGGDQDATTVKVSLDRVQRSGVRSQAAEMRHLVRPVRAPGVAKPDERSLRTVSLRTDGFIEKLFVNSLGQQVQAGQPMFVVYSPQIVTALIDYRNALQSFAGDTRGEQGAMQRLRNYGVPDTVLKQLPTRSDPKPDIVLRELRAKADPHLSITWSAPMSGVVMQKSVVEGQMVKAGDELYRLADLSSIWVIADVAEQDIGLIKVGAPARMSFRAYPGEMFKGLVSFILHDLDMGTRTAKVRIELKNPDHRIKHEMFADVEIDAGAGEAMRLVVPSSAIIDSGNRQVVFVDKGEGRFEPRAVKIGMRGDDYTEITDGLKGGENVVVAANFLIDAESNLKAALQSFAAPSAATTEMKRLPEVKP